MLFIGILLMLMDVVIVLALLTINECLPYTFVQLYMYNFGVLNRYDYLKNLGIDHNSIFQEIIQYSVFTESR